MKNPEHKQPHGAAGCVNQHIGETRRARGHKNLMKFVAGSVKENDEQRAADFRPRPRRQIRFGRVQRAPEQQREHGVFGEMTAFAEQMMNEFNVRLRHLRKQPAQKRFDD